jgi:hypothetical protein
VLEGVGENLWDRAEAQLTRQESGDRDFIGGVQAQRCVAPLQTRLIGEFKGWETIGI